LLAIGWVDKPEPDESDIFHHLVYRNALNMHFSTAVSRVIYGGQREKALAKELSSALKYVESDHGLQGVELPCLPPSRIDRLKIRRALLLVGSPRGRKSTSQQLGGYLMTKLAERGISTETIQLYPALGSRERIHSLLETIDASDLILLACPLYIDSLPGPVTRALEMIAIRSETILSPGGYGRPAFAAIVNSGFPEAEQSQTALAICAQFAIKAGFTWSGGLALGGGSSLIDGKPLDELGWRGKSIRASLELFAMNLASGKPIPDEAVRMMAKKRVPKWMVLLFGPIKWILMARKYGAVLTMWRKPFLD
jgi:multimeric flavodoxin WrbA